MPTAISFHAREKTLFVKLHENPNHETLRSLGELLTLASEDSRLFLDLRDLSAITNQETASLRDVLSASSIPSHNIYFKGEIGFSVAVDGNKVLITRKKAHGAEAQAEKPLARPLHTPHKCRCGGNCKSCRNHRHEVRLAS